MKTNIIGLKELRNNMDSYIKKVLRGDSFVVVKRSKPVFKISSPDMEKERWEKVIDFTQIRKGGIPLKEILKRL